MRQGSHGGGGGEVTESFDFEQHRQNAVNAYQPQRRRYERFAATIETILRKALEGVPTHHIGARAKSLDSFADKAAKPHPEDPEKPKYVAPMNDIEDLAGARVIAYVLQALRPIEDAVKYEFEVIERSDKGDRLVENALVGYRSIHLIVQMKPERTRLPEYAEFDGLRAEIQIRTILQHAWAEIEHDLRYKPGQEPNKELSQRLTALAGLIEVGDREFDQIHDIDRRRTQEFIDLSQINEIIDTDTSRAFDSQGVRTESVHPEAPPPEPANEAEIDVRASTPSELMRAGLYSDAILRYNKLIRMQPTQFAHYLGRAKARFLYGDAVGARQDIDFAETLSPENPIVARVRGLIEGDHAYDTLVGDYTAVLRQGHNALRDGDPETALQKYYQAESLGFSPVLTVFNTAMAHFLAKDYDLARKTLDRIDPHRGTPLRFNVFLLRILSYLITGGAERELMLNMVESELERAIEKMNYRYAGKSHVADLEQGVHRTLSAEEFALIEPIFKVLHRADPEPEARDAA